MRSMTGIGNGRASRDEISLEIEVRSVNHRFLDLSSRLPSALTEFEPRIRERIQAEISRGRVTLAAELEAGDGGTTVEFDHGFVEAFVRSLRELGHRLDIADDLALSHVAALEEAYRQREREIPHDVRAALVEEALDGALDQLQRMREKEGDSLARELGRRLDAVAEHMRTIAAHSEDLGVTLRKRLEERLAAARAEDAVDPQRLAAEVALLVDRATISEEVERMASHLEQARECLDADGPAAKRLGFLLQEMHREVNTMGSKSSLLEITNAVVHLKEELESMREQIQNLE